MRNNTPLKITASLLTVIFLSVTGCDEDTVEKTPKNPDEAEIVSIDRFSDDAAVLMKRSDNSELPGINEPVNFDLGDFITQSYGPNGEIVKYYNFDVQPLSPAPLYLFYKPGSDKTIEGQLSVIDVIPGDEGYNDFWQVYKVIVPDNYIANTITSYDEIVSSGYTVEETASIVNCPIVPQGSSANLRLGNESNQIDRGWYKGKIAYYFTFMEKELNVNSAGLLPFSPIYVTFNINPDDTNPNSGPPSGIVTEPGSLQTHNVIATIPSDTDYSPLWSVYVYDNADFDQVSDLQTVENANILAEGVMYVNCPVVYITN